MVKKNRTGLQLSLVVLVLTGVLIFAVFNNSGFATASSAEEEMANAYFIENSCLECHISETPHVSWYCHKALPADTYFTRMYLRLHLDWVVQELTIPDALYIPPPVQPGQDALVHLFNRRLFPLAVNITPGKTVTWTNLDVRDYTLQGDSPSRPLPFGTVTLKPGESLSYTFNEVGVYPYIYIYAEVQPTSEELYKTGYGKLTVAP